MRRTGDMIISGITNSSAKMAGRDIVESNGGYGIGTLCAAGTFCIIVAGGGIIVFGVVRYIFRWYSEYNRDGIASLFRGLFDKIWPNADIKDMCKYDRDDVDVKPASKKDYKNHLKEDSVYPITKKRKGNVLILNNFKFANDKNNIDSGEREGILIRELFVKLGCKVEEANNKKAEKMQNKLKKFAENPCHANADFSVVFILSHGARVTVRKQRSNSDHDVQTDQSSKTDNNRSDDVDVFYGTDGRFVEVSYVIELFEDDKCTSLKNKPKLFFFEFCRIVYRDGSDENDSASDLPSPTDMLERLTQSRDLNRRTTTNDMLLTFTTHKGDLSKCKFFTNAMLNVFSKKSHKNSVTDMLKEVKRGMDKESSNKWQMADTRDNLMKSLYFFPGFPT